MKWLSNRKMLLAKVIFLMLLLLNTTTLLADGLVRQQRDLTVCRDSKNRVTNLGDFERLLLENQRYEYCHNYGNDGKPIDNNNCVYYDRCGRSLVTNSIGEGVDKNSYEIFRSKVLPELQARNADLLTKKILADRLKEIEEKIKLKKYYALVLNDPNLLNSDDSCSNDSASNKCNGEEFDKIFESLQATCNDQSGFPCRNLEEAKFKNFEIKNNYETKTAKYLNQIAKNEMMDIRGKDKELIAYLAEVIKDKNNKFDKKNYNKTVRSIAENLLKYFKDSNGKKTSDASVTVDPFFGSLDLDSMTNFVKSVANEKISSIEEAKLKIIKFRKDSMSSPERLYAVQSCNQRMSLNSICNLKANILAGEKGQADVANTISANDLNKLFAQNEKELKDHFDQFLVSISKDNLSLDFSTFKTLMYGHRCYLTYNFNQCTGDQPFITSDESFFSGTNNLKEPTGGFSKPVEDAIKTTEDSSRNVSLDTTERISGLALPKRADKVDVNSGSINTIIQSASVATGKMVTGDLGKEKVGRAENVDLNKAMIDTFSRTTAQGLVPSSPSFNNKPQTSSTYLPPIPQDISGDKTKASSEGDTIGSLNKKIDTLSKRLEEQQAELDRKKAERDGSAPAIDDKAKSEREDQIRTLESQLGSLKKEIADARAKRKAIEELSTASSEQSPISGRTNATLDQALRTKSSETESKASIPSSVGNSPTADMKTNGVSTNSSGAGSVPAAGTSSPTIASSLKGQSLVLTKLDGMSAEVLNETINNKIQESNGQPFLIEEGGFVKEIIPVLKDGKVVLDEKGRPVFEKIIKGKVGEVKIKDPKYSKPSISSQADLKKTDEVAKERDRLRYEALRKLSSEAAKQD